VLKLRKSANNETKMLLGYFGHDFVLTNKKPDLLVRSLGNKMFAFGLQF